MNRGMQLIKNTIIITIGKLCTQIVSFFLLPLYTALLTKEDYGIVDLLNNIVSLLLPIITFQMEHAIFRYLIDNREKEERKRVIISTSVIIIGVQCFLYILLFLIMSPFIHNEYKYFLISNTIACVFSSISLQICRGNGDNTTYTLGSFISAASIILFNIIFIAILKFGAYGMLMANLIGNFICFVFIFMKNKIYKYIDIRKFDWNTLKSMWKYSIPMIPNALSWWVFNSSDRVIVTQFLGLASNGIIAISNKFSGVYINIYNIFNMTWTETASLHISDKDKDEFFSKVINTVLKFFSAICFGIIGFMPFVFPIMINSQYIEAYRYIPINMIASLGNVGVGLLSAIYIANKESKAVAKTSIVSAIINIFVHLFLIDKIGLWAASISTLCAYYVMFIYRIIDIKKYVNIRIEKKLIFSIIGMSILTIILYYQNHFIGNIINIFLVIIYAIVVNFKSIKMVKNIIIKKEI